MDEMTVTTRIEAFLARIVNGSGEIPEPETDTELYLAAICGESVTLPEPDSRFTTFLARILGESVTLPVPQTRAELYLAKICGEDVDVPMPLTRLDAWLALWAESGGGTETTVTGVAPIVLAAALAHHILSLTQTGKCEQRNIPAEYTELEYIESTGTQYIDTGLGVTETTRAKATFAFTSTTPSTRRVFGKIAGSSSTAFSFREYTSFYWFGSNSITAGTDTDKHTVEFRTDGKVYKDNVEIGVKGTFGNPGTGNVYVFAELSDGGNINYGSVRIYAYTQYDGNDVVLNLIPAKRNSDDALGMYDTVSGSFFTNAGTGSFTAGSVTVPTPSAPMDIWCNNGRVVAGNCVSNRPDGQGTFVTPSELTTTRIYKAFPTDLVVGRSYTVTVTGADWTIIVQKKKPDDTDKNNVSGWVTTYNFTPEDGYIYGVAMQKTSGGSAVVITPADFNGTLTLDTADGKPWAVGTPETLTVSGNIVEFTETRIDNTTWAEADKSHGFEVRADVYGKSVGNSLFFNANSYGAFVPCKLGESVSINFFDYNPYYGRCYYCEVTADGKCNTEPVKFSSTAAITQQTFTLTQTDSIGFAIEWYISSTERDYTKENYAICYGTTPLAAYQPYTPIQTVNDVSNLLAVGDYADTEELVNGIKTGKVGVLVIDGVTEGKKIGAAWNSTYKRGSFAVGGMLSSASSVKDALCTRFDYSSSVYGAPTKDGFCTNSGTVFLSFIEETDVNSADDANAKLAAWYAEGKPAILFYPKAEASTTQTTAHALSTSNGTNRIGVASNVDPVTLSCRYMASS